MDPHRSARVAGWLYLLTFVTSIPALALKQPFLDGGGSATAARWAVVLEIVLAVACVGTAIALLPVLRPAEHLLGLGFVASRTVEAALVMIGAGALWALTRTDPATGDALAALHDAAFLLGPGLLPAVNAALLATALWRGRLVPRAIPLLGLVGAPLLLGSTTASLLGGLDQVSATAGLLALPIGLWELSLGVWLATRGVRPTQSS